MLRRRSSLWLALALVHCGPPAQPVTSQPGPVMPPDLKPVMERFAPTQVPLGQAFGVSGFGGDSVPGAPPSTELDALASLHAGILRRDFTWSRIEPQPGTFDYSADDQAVEALSQQGVALLGILDYSAKWSIANGDEHAAPDPALFAAYAKSVAAHYAGRVRYWEVWNEENSGLTFWHPRQDPAAYATLLVEAASAIREADPAAHIVFGGLWWHDEGVVEAATDFVEDAFAARPDLARSFDVLAIHPYPASYPGHVPPEASQPPDVPVGLMVARMRAVLDAYGAKSTPIWADEYGYPIYGAVDEAAQARWLVRATVELLASGADEVSVFTLRDGPHPDLFPPEDAFGLLHYDGTPKRAFSALTTLLGFDPGARLAADESAGPVRAYRFEGPRARFHVLFAPDESPHPFTLAAPPGSQVLDELGNPPPGISLPSLVVSGDPLYVLE